MGSNFLALMIGSALSGVTYTSLYGHFRDLNHPEYIWYMLAGHLKLSFVVSMPPPPGIAYQELQMAAETGGEYFFMTFYLNGGEAGMICGSLGASNGFRDTSPRF